MFLLAIATTALLTSASPTVDALSDYMARSEACGFSGTVLVAKGDKVLFRGAYGYADKLAGKRMTTDSVLESGSLSKQYTAVAILKLVDQNRLALTDTLGKFFPQAPADKAAITVRQLLNQSSGLDDDYWDEHPELTEAQYTALVLGRPLLGEPGKGFHYANFNYHLLKQISELTTRESYESFLRKDLLIPAGCLTTGFKLPHWKPGQVARYQDWSNESTRFDATNLLARPIDLQPEGSGGILTTADDLFRWLVALRNGKLLSKASTATLFTPGFGGYASGWFIGTTARGTRMIYHGGFGTGSGVVSGCYWYPQDDLTIVMLANTNQNRSLHHDFFVPEIENLVLGGPVDFPPNPIPVPYPSLTRLVGAYSAPNGAKVAAALQGPSLTMQTGDPKTMIALRFMDPDQGSATAPDAKMIAAAINGDLSLVHADLDPRINWPAYSFGVAATIAQFKSRLGAFVSASQVWQRSATYSGSPEIQTFVAVQFQKGYLILRTIRNSRGKLTQIDPRGPYENMEMTLCPLGNGRFQTWDFATNSGTTVTFGKNNLTIGSTAFAKIPTNS